MYIHEVNLDDASLSLLIRFSEDWEKEESCYGYRANEKDDIEGRRIFFAEDNGEVIGYLFGKAFSSENMHSVMPESTPCFEVEEIYVVPSRRSQGVGQALFRFAEDNVKKDAEYIVLSTATKNCRAILHFYLDELDMTFWSATLFKKIR